MTQERGSATHLLPERVNTAWNALHELLHDTGGRKLRDAMNELSAAIGEAWVARAQPSETATPSRQELAERLVRFARLNGTLSVHGLQAALLDAATALSETKAPS